MEEREHQADRAADEVQEASLQPTVEEEQPALEARAEEPQASEEGVIQAEEAAQKVEGEAEGATQEVEGEAEEAAQEAEGEAEEAAEPVDDGRRWYVIHSYSGYENKVKKNLEQRIESMEMQDQIFQVIVPTEEEVELRDGQRRTISKRVFPGYILVQMIMSDDSWYVVRNTPGVTGFVGMGNKPTALSQEEVDKIMKRIESEAPRVRISYRVGQKVRIVDGPFAEFVGTVDDVSEEKAKVKVLVSFFGRETPVELDYLQVEKV